MKLRTNWTNVPKDVIDSIRQLNPFDPSVESDLVKKLERDNKIRSILDEEILNYNLDDLFRSDYGVKKSKRDHKIRSIIGDQV